MHKKNGMSKQVLQYKREGRRNIGRPCKLWRDQLYFYGLGTGITRNHSKPMMM